MLTNSKDFQEEQEVYITIHSKLTNVILSKNINNIDQGVMKT